MFSFGKTLQASGVVVVHSGDHCNTGLVSRNILPSSVVAVDELTELSLAVDELTELSLAVDELTELSLAVDELTELSLAADALLSDSALLAFEEFEVSEATTDAVSVDVDPVLTPLDGSEVADAKVSLALGATIAGAGFSPELQLKRENAATPSVAATATLLIARRSFLPLHPRSLAQRPGCPRTWGEYHLLCIRGDHPKSHVGRASSTSGW